MPHWVRRLAPGDFFAGYLIESLAGRGGMGLVFRARQLRPERLVAVKVIMPELAGEADFRARFEQEASLAAQIEHPNVIPIYGVGEEDGLLYIAMRFVESTDLAVFLRGRGRLEPPQATRIIAQIAAALDSAHQRGLVHRDIKPANVLVAADEHLYLTDFGLTKRVTDFSGGGVTATGGFVGTLDYIAPEQVSGMPVDARGDIYALGCVLYELLTGDVPFPRDQDVAKIFAHVNLTPPPPSGEAPTVPAELDAVVARAMAKDPSARFQSAGEFARAAVAAASRGTANRIGRAAASGVWLRGASDAPTYERGRGLALPGRVRDRAGRGELHAVPPLPPAFVAREELVELRESLLRPTDGAPATTGPRLGLHGPGGIGKTVLAAALAGDESLRRRFPDGVFWVAVGEHPDLVALQIELLTRLGHIEAELRSATKGVRMLRDALAEVACLLVVDDVWTAAAAQAFAAAGPRGRVLYTTRDAAVLGAVGAHALLVDVLSVQTARELLAGFARTAVDALPQEAMHVLEATGRVALALALVGAAVGRGGRSWPDVVEELKQGGETFLDHPYANAFKAMQVAVSSLDAELASAYESLAVYPEDTRVPLAAVSRYWARIWDADIEQTRAQLEALAARELLSLDEHAIVFHDLQRDFLLLQAGDLSVLHDDLLAAYRVLLPSPHGPWRELPQDEPYIWEHLVYHLRGVGDAAGVLRLASDLAYLALRSFRSGPYAAESDLREAAELHPNDAGVRWLLRLFTQWGHLLTGHRKLGDLAATLVSRTRGAPGALDTAVLDGLLPTPRLAARWGLPCVASALKRVLAGHVNCVFGAAFSPDGRLVASCGDDGSVRLWDAVTGGQTATLSGHSAYVFGVAFSPDGHLLASAGDDWSVRLWDPASGTQTARLDGHSGGVLAVAFSPNGHLLASASGDGSVRLWDAATRTQVARLDGHSGAVLGVAFSPDGRVLASAGSDGSVRLWDAISRAPSGTLEGHTDWVGGVAFSRDGRVVASSGGETSVRLWDSVKCSQAAMLEGHTSCVSGVAFSPDASILASASNDGSVRLWDALSGLQTTVLEGHTNWVTGVTFSPDGRVLASTSYDGSVRLWDVAGGAQPGTLKSETEWVRTVACSRDGRVLASAGGDDGSAHLRDADSGEETATLAGHTRSVVGLAFSPDGHTLASASHDHSVRLWDTSSGAQRLKLGGHTDSVLAVAFSPDGRVLASASGDASVRLWDARSGAPLASLEGHTGEVFGVAFSPDGRILVSAANDRLLRLWDVRSGKPIATLEGHTGGVRAAAFSPDGSVVVSASYDGSMRLWDAPSGAETAILEGHTSGVIGVAFSPNGHLLASTGWDGSVRLWDAATTSEVCQLRLGLGANTLVWASSGIAVAAHTGVIGLKVVNAGSA